MIPDVFPGGGDMAHGDRFRHDEVVGGEHRGHRPGRPGPDPVRGQQHTGRGAPVAGLGEHRDRGVSGDLARNVGRVGHHDGLRRWDQLRHPVQGVAQRCRRVARAAGEDDRPEISSRIAHGLDLPREGRGDVSRPSRLIVGWASRAAPRNRTTPRRPGKSGWWGPRRRSRFDRGRGPLRRSARPRGRRRGRSRRSRGCAARR